MTIMSYSEVLGAVRRWPLEEQMSMAEEILHSLRSALKGKQAEQKVGDLIPLFGLNAQELRVLAEAVVAPDRQHRLKVLLERNRRGDLSPQEQRELDNLLVEVDQVALLKARARYTIGLLAVDTETAR
jgi:hypothetical protein